MPSAARRPRARRRRGVARLGAVIQLLSTSQRLHKLLVKRGRLSAERLIGLPVAGKQRRRHLRHLVGTGGQQPGRLARRCAVGRRERRADARQIRRRRRQHVRNCH